MSFHEFGHCCEQKAEKLASVVEGLDWAYGCELMFVLSFLHATLSGIYYVKDWSLSSTVKTGYRRF